MANDTQSYREVAHELLTTGSGYDVLRYICLPDLLGKEASSLLYIMGRNLARKLRPETLEDIMEYFKTFGWGELQLEKEKRREMIFQLTGSTVQQRFNTINDVEYRLEAGFLAESLELTKDKPCECFSEVNTKNKSVQFNAIYVK